MVRYNLEEDPNIFLTPQYYENEFEYRMENINKDGDRKVIRSIDLRSDKLVIYGTEIKQSLFKRLYDSLILRNKAGIVYVNCDGACYFLTSGKISRPIHNEIFDWSSFGVTIPHSVNDSLKKQLAEKEKNVNDLNHQLSSTEANLKASMEEVEGLKRQLSDSKKERQEIGVKLEEAYQRIALADFELELSKVELESSKKGEEELLDELCSCREKTQNIELELQRLQAQISAVNSELQSTKIKLEISTKSMKEFANELSLCKQERQELETQLRRVEEEDSSIRFELQSIKSEKQYMEVEMAKKVDQLCLIDKELMFINQKLDQVLNSRLWAKVYGCHISQWKQENGDSDLSSTCNISSFVIEIT